NEFLSTHSYNLSGPLKILMENIGADHGFIVLERDGKWIIETKKTFPDLDAVSGINIDIDFAGGKTDEPVLSEKIVKTVIKNRENLLINNPHKDNNFTNDPYIVSHKPCSVYCMPLIHRSKIKGVLYLENNCSGNEFTDEKLQILNLLSSQIATLIDNAEIFWELETLNRNLEKKVEERTQEIILQKEEILAQRDEIEDKNKILQNAYNEITLKNRDITDSINYAKRIQTSVLPPVEYVKDIVPQSFILFKPKDILSGDFYWIEKYSGKSNSKQNDSKNSEFIIAAAVDCTGHGVPGALLSIMGYNLLSNIVNEYKYTKPSDILNILQKGVRNYLRQQDNDLKSKDGMDLSLISYDKNNRKLQFAGARNKLFLIKHGELITIKGDRQSIGGHISKKYRGKSFTNYEFEICNDDLVYIFSDGYIDQFGGPNNLKFSYNAFGKLLLSIHKKSLEEQKIILNETLEDWKNSQRQIDDILVMGFKFSSVK
ncbi:MAG: SpoIIE family protein phosphatase, partial [Bacteroidales bacterium]|nr:SpoIIE family protein phosphatase [Bacteroidales bacterium]